MRQIALTTLLIALLLSVVVPTARPYSTPDSLGVAWDNLGGIDIIAGQPAPFVCGFATETNSLVDLQNWLLDNTTLPLVDC